MGSSSRAFAWFIFIGGRLAFLALWLFTPVVKEIFASPLVPVLAFLFAPLTGMTYALIENTSYPASSFGWFWVILVMMFALDIAADFFVVIGLLPDTDASKS